METWLLRSAFTPHVMWPVLRLFRAVLLLLLRLLPLLLSLHFKTSFGCIIYFAARLQKCRWYAGVDVVAVLQVSQQSIVFPLCQCRRQPVRRITVQRQCNNCQR